MGTVVLHIYIVVGTDDHSWDEVYPRRKTRERAYLNEDVHVLGKWFMQHRLQAPMNTPPSLVVSPMARDFVHTGRAGEMARAKQAFEFQHKFDFPANGQAQVRIMERVNGYDTQGCPLVLNLCKRAV